MHPVLQLIATELDQLALQVASLPAGNPFGIAHNNWSFPVITSDELRERVEEIARDIRDRGKDSLDAPTETRLNDYPRRLVFLRTQTVPQIWGNGQVGVSAFSEALDGLQRALRPALQGDPTQDISGRLARLRTQVGGLETRLKLLQPRASDLEGMVKSIESTYSAAQELPMALDEVQDAKAQVKAANAEIEANKAIAAAAARDSATALGVMQLQANTAQKLIEDCEAAYRSSVGQGLAAAFHERSRQLYWTMWGWVAGLVASLAGGAAWSSYKIGELLVAARAGATPSMVVLDGVMAAISVAAPVWFGWLATRHIGQYFRLSEDYAFKASVARSYEGYRKQAESVSDDLVEELLASAIRRVGEEPLRVVETGSPGSPWHDLAHSPVVNKAMDTIPEFASRVRELAAQALKSKDTPEPKKET